MTQEIGETERMVANLISDSLRNFSSRLGELDLAVKTPLDLLSKSNVLAQKHRDLENKVVHIVTMHVLKCVLYVLKPTEML